MKKKKKVDYKEVAKAYEELVDKKNELIKNLERQIELDKKTFKILNDVIDLAEHEAWGWKISACTAGIAFVIVLIGLFLK